MMLRPEDKAVVGVDIPLPESEAMFERSRKLQTIFYTALGENPDIDIYHDFLTPETEARSKHRGVDTSTDTEPYSFHWKSLLDGTCMRKQKEQLEKHLKGKIVIDLFAGRWDKDGSAIQDIADKAGAKWYIAQDKYADPEDPLGVGITTVKNERLGIEQPRSGMEVDYCTGDALNAVASLPDNAKDVVFFLNGVNCTNLNNPRYHEVVAREIVRALPEGGVVATCGADAAKLFPELGLQLVEGYETNPVTQLWIKPEGHEMDSEWVQRRQMDREIKMLAQWLSSTSLGKEVDARLAQMDEATLQAYLARTEALAREYNQNEERTGKESSLLMPIKLARLKNAMKVRLALEQN